MTFSWRYPVNHLTDARHHSGAEKQMDDQTVLLVRREMPRPTDRRGRGVRAPRVESACGIGTLGSQHNGTARTTTTCP
jgi:hypothetical protein